MAIENKGTALITGASSGIGEVYADRLAKRGYDLVLVARNTGRLDALAARLGAETGRKIEVLSADLGVAADRRRVEQRLRTDAAISLLVNNAGIAVNGPAGNVDPDELEAMIEINITALVRLAAAVVPGLTARGKGAIVNISSAMAFLPVAGAASYSGTKAFVLNFSRALHEEVKDSGVHVQAVLPGYTKTPMLDASAFDDLPASIVMGVDELVDAALAGLDLGEIVTIPSLPEIAEWDKLEAAREALVQNISRDHPAARYGIAQIAAA